jgi:hypothetical protein
LLLALLLMASPVDSLHLGASEKDVTEGLRRTADKVEWIDAGQSQAMRRALLDTGLLAAINRSGAAPKRKDGGFDFGAFSRFALAEAGAHRYVAVMAQGGLRFLLVVKKVPIDATKDRDGWNPARLHRIKSAITELSPYDLKPTQRDRWGNSFEWKGKKGRDQIAVWLVPESDELRVLMY